MANALERKKGQDWANLVLAVLLFISPWVVGFATAAAASWNAWIVGIAIAALAIAALTAFAVWEEWINLVLGLWLIISPWALSFSTTVGAMWTHVVLGIIAVVISAWALWDYQQETHARA
jgi:hypothetical protein